MKKYLVLAIALILTLVVSAVSADQNFMIDLATAYAADAPAGVALQKFVDDVREKSGGSIDISLFTDGTLGNTTDNYASVASGDLDMTMAGLEGLDLYAPEYTFLDSPFLISDWDHMMALLNSGIGDTLKARYEENGFGPVCRDLESTVDAMIREIENDCSNDPKYLKRVEAFYPYFDENNCQRVFDSLCEIKDAD